EVGIGEQPGRVGRERGAAGQAEEGWIIALDPLPDLAAHREVGRLALVEGDELQALDERRLLLVAQEAVVLPPPDDVELGADRAGLLGRRETGEGRQEQHGRPLHASLKPWRLRGSDRIRVPVAAKSAFVTAGTSVTGPTSPVPPRGRAPLSMMCTSIGGASWIWGMRKPSKLRSTVRPSRKEMADLNAAPIPHTVPPSSEDLEISGSSAVPQSMTHTTRWMLTRPSSAESSTTCAMCVRKASA